MQIEVVSINTNTVPTAKGSYQVTEVAYKDMKDGKINGKKIMSFANKEVYKVMTNLKLAHVIASLCFDTHTIRPLALFVKY